MTKRFDQPIANFFGAISVFWVLFSGVAFLHLSDAPLGYGPAFWRHIIPCLVIWSIQVLLVALMFYFYKTEKPKKVIWGAGHPGESTSLILSTSHLIQVLESCLPKDDNLSKVTREIGRMVEFEEKDFRLNFPCLEDDSPIEIKVYKGDTEELEIDISAYPEIIDDIEQIVTNLPARPAN